MKPLSALSSSFPLVAVVSVVTLAGAVATFEIVRKETMKDVAVSSTSETRTVTWCSIAGTPTCASGLDAKPGSFALDPTAPAMNTGVIVSSVR